MSAIAALRECGNIQKKMFFGHFMANNKIGEITCVNGIDNEDTFLFERFEVSGVHFIVCFRLMSEDSCDSGNVFYLQQTIADFVALKQEEQDVRYTLFLKKLLEEGKTLDEFKEEIMAKGGDATSVDKVVFTRELIEDTMECGRRRINGDRNTRIQILHRHTDIPNDLQKAALSAFVLPMPEELKELMTLVESEKKEEWQDKYLSPMIRDEVVACHLPMFSAIVDVKPIIYRFPEREVDVAKASGLN